jgi:rhamnosyltransferase
MICSVTVTWNPDPAFLGYQIRSLAAQVDRILLIDNGSEHACVERMRANLAGCLVQVECLGMNVGLAQAQNIGICKAFALGATEVLLLDQDSLPYSGMVGALQEALGEDAQVAAVGPLRIDRRTGTRSHFVADAMWWPVRWRPSASDSAPGSAEVGVLIASGTLAKRCALEQSGLMREDLFIDHVDTEWCLRIRSQGWQLRGVPRALMLHSVGEAVRRHWLFGWREVALHTPTRTYFVNRNTLLLLASSFVPCRWKAFIAVRTLMLDLYLLVTASHRLERSRMIFAGLSDGARGRGGPLTR